MDTTWSSKIRRWTHEVDMMRRRADRSNDRDKSATSRLMADSLTTCQGLLQDLAHREEECDRLRQLVATERANWERLFDVIPLACVLTDAQGTIIAANRAAALMLNVGAVRLHGQLLMYYVSDRQLPPGASVTRVPVRVRPREKAPVEVEMLIAEVNNDTSDRLWFLMPAANGRRVQSITPASRDSAAVMPQTAAKPHESEIAQEI